VPEEIEVVLSGVEPLKISPVSGASQNRASGPDFAAQTLLTGSPN
jgi:hypothetical protein